MLPMSQLAESNGAAKYFGGIRGGIQETREVSSDANPRFWGPGSNPSVSAIRSAHSKPRQGFMPRLAERPA